ncbi:hypothetical protein OU994_04785 [Pseudoduganella sp. SL102]|uniref:hypothetical protein n=1 Tax=Pseudoduganella sp. SL102 TaxID=2995154 RepID=UPI00248D0967|nr:hypothetical protein [Pseudoduganella sp. SL102]WBS03628.1 hypothetical protein OU994_04785 [Pseudoduganella sp. SL102]
MKKLLAVTIVVLLFIAACNAFDSPWGHDFHVNVDGEEFDGPFGWVVGVLLAGGGLLIGAIVVVCVAILVGLLFAGLGVLVVFGLAALGVAIAAALSPLLLPLAIVIGLVWYFSRRDKRRAAAMKEAAV